MALKSENIPAGYKNSALGVIPNEWEIYALGELGDILSGLTYSPDDVQKDGILVLRSSNIQHRRLQFDDNVFVNIKGIYNAVKTGDILVCVRNGSKNLIGKNTLITEKADGMAFGAFMSIYRSEYNYYLFHLFNTDFFAKEIYKNLGATINSINGSDLKKFKFPIPSVKEGIKIANCLSTWDKVVENYTHLIDQKKLQKNQLKKQLLFGKQRLKGFSKAWNEVHINEISKEVSLRNKTDKPLTVLSCTKYSGLVPSLEYFGRKIYSEDVSTYKIVPMQHFAYATNHIEEGSIGYQENFEEALISPMYTVFKTNESVNDFFFYKLLKSHRLIHEYNARMEGSIDRRGGLRWDAFSIIKIKIPSIEEQDAIANVLSCADKEIELLKAKLNKLKLQKKGLMQVLLTGKKRLKY